MAWNDTMRTILRVLVNDTESPQTYSDSRLDTLLAVAARYVKQDVDFDEDYTIDVATPDITPDPTTATVTDNDDIFTNFVVMKAACLVDQSTFRTEALRAGIKARCGPATLETIQRLPGFKQLLELGPCAAYKSMKDEYEFGNAHICKAILSPFTGNNFDAENL